MSLLPPRMGQEWHPVFILPRPMGQEWHGSVVFSSLNITKAKTLTYIHHVSNGLPDASVLSSAKNSLSLHDFWEIWWHLYKHVTLAPLSPSRGRAPKTGRCTRRDESVFLENRCVLLTCDHSRYWQYAILRLWKFRFLCCCCTQLQVRFCIYVCFTYDFPDTSNVQNRRWIIDLSQRFLAAAQTKIAYVMRG